MGAGYSSSQVLDTKNLGREVDLTINGVSYKVSNNVPAETSLNTFIREVAQLKGTKFMCQEGGCGVCIVAATYTHPATGKPKTYAVNSCLIPIFVCHGWAITTIEGLGGKENGYNKISKRLAAANGTQCGYCSPAMVMNMHCLLESNPKVTMKEVENSFGSNICRCTGYRPIMEAFKSMASDAPKELTAKLQDIEANEYRDMIDWEATKINETPITKVLSSEDLREMRSGDRQPVLKINEHLMMPCHTQAVGRCVKEASKHVFGAESRDGFIRARLLDRALNPVFESKKDFKADLMCSELKLSCSESCAVDGKCCKSPDNPRKGLYFQLKDGTSWFRPGDRKEVFEVLDMIGEKSYRLISGNTGHGVYRHESDPEVYIDLNGVAELHSIQETPGGLSLGANLNLTEAMELFRKLAKEKPEQYAYCQTMADHIDLIASIPVRNAGSMAGNLFMKHRNNEFPSDLFLFLEMAAATLVIVDSTGMENEVGMLEFLKTDMTRKLIYKVNLPPYDSKFYVTRSFKIMPRAQNAHAYVNAGFRFKLDPKTFTVMEKPTLVFGGIEPSFLHATKTEEYLKDKKLINDTTLKGALEILESELKPDHVLPDATPEYRKGLALSLFYKFVLGISPKEVNEKYASGGPLLERPVSSASQDFDTNPKVWPLNKPMPKIEGLIQCSGEAEYVNDMPAFEKQLWGQLVLCDRARAVVAKIDPSEALKVNGVVAFFSAEDIPGKNNFYPPNMIMVDEEKVFAEGRTEYAGEAVGVIVAESHALAVQAAKLVKIEYSDQQKVLADGREIVDQNITDRISNGPNGVEPTSQGKDVKFKISGKLDLKAQYHYTMEPLTSISVPKEKELDVYPSTQWPAAIHEAVSAVLNIPQNKINIHQRRVGGGYGAKVSRSNHTACVTSIAAWHLQRPVRMVLKLENNMEWAGKRFPVFCDYEVGVNGDGVIQYLNVKVYQDNGCSENDSPMFYTAAHIVNCYNPATWSIKTFYVKTDTPGNTWCRGPASTEGICLIETIMDRIANTVGKDPLQVRIANMLKDNNPIPGMIEDIKKSSDYDKRAKEINDFNQKNRWKKRGIALVPMTYPVEYYAFFHAVVSVFGVDGTVCITSGGVEMGQGLNTKVVQVAAHVLGIDVWKISVKPFNGNITPNNASTGGSIGSECICYAVKKCCEEINQRLEPIRKELGEKATWEEIIKQAYFKLINLQATYWETPAEFKNYEVHGVTVLEVEVDILTGQYHTSRVDLLEDTGESISPEIDIGQIEGGFIMGLGYYTSEELVYNKETGRLYSNRTWFYKPPGAKDIPIDFRVTLRKNAPNPFGVLRSKATGEPPLCMSCSVTLAIRNALESARKDSGIKQEVWFDMEYPYTAERIWLGGLTKKEMFKIK